MRNSSAANSAASSPPVPARISSTTFFSSFGSLRQQEDLDLAARARRAAPRATAAPPGPARACRGRLRQLLRLADLGEHRLELAEPLDEGSISARALACVRYCAGSVCTAGSARRSSSSLYRDSTEFSLSIMTVPSAPETGGRNATSSPSPSSVVRRANSCVDRRRHRPRRAGACRGTRRPTPPTASATVAPAGTSRCSSPAPASSRSLREESDCYRMRARTPAPRASGRRGRRSRPPPRTSPPSKNSRFQTGRPA